MVEALTHARAQFEHRGLRGDGAERALREFLRCYLPRRLAVGYGEVVDSYGVRTRQVDVVVANDDQPFTFADERPGFFFVEGVSAAGEVKAVLTSDGLADTCANAESVARLRARRTPDEIVRTSPVDYDRFYRRPPYFLVAYESQLSLTTIRDRLDEAAGKNGALGGVDGAFVLGRGWVIDFGDGRGMYQFRTPEGSSVSGRLAHESERVLFDLMGWLSSTMPRSVRFYSILTRYLVGEWANPAEPPATRPPHV